jgi:hypothetical protein
MGAKAIATTTSNDESLSFIPTSRVLPRPSVGHALQE